MKTARFTPNKNKLLQIKWREGKSQAAHVEPGSQVAACLRGDAMTIHGVSNRAWAHFSAVLPEALRLSTVRLAWSTAWSSNSSRVSGSPRFRVRPSSVSPDAMPDAIPYPDVEGTIGT